MSTGAPPVKPRGASSSPDVVAHDARAGLILRGSDGTKSDRGAGRALGSAAPRSHVGGTPHHGPVTDPTLTPHARALLAFEEQHGTTHTGAKAVAIRDTFDLSGPVYYQQLWRLIDEPAAEAAAPMLVHRLRRIRDARFRHRTGHPITA